MRRGALCAMWLRQVIEDAGTEGALRLTEDGAGGGTDPAVGVLEVFHAGAWGTVCEGERGLNTDDYAPAFTDVSLLHMTLSTLGHLFGFRLLMPPPALAVHEYTASSRMQTCCSRFV